MFTPREQQVMDRIACGLCNKRIAIDLVIGLGTVKVHVHNILSKLGATSRLEALVKHQQGVSCQKRD